MAFSVNSWRYIRLSAHGSWPRGAGLAPGARRSAPGPFPAPGPALLRATGAGPAPLGPEPGAEYNAKN